MTNPDSQPWSTVQFTAMEHGIRADYDPAFAHEQEQIDTQADWVLEWLASDGRPVAVSDLPPLISPAVGDAGRWDGC